jgi:hypothetical protein
MPSTEAHSCHLLPRLDDLLRPCASTIYSQHEGKIPVHSAYLVLTWAEEDIPPELVVQPNSEVPSPRWDSLVVDVSSRLCAPRVFVSFSTWRARRSRSSVFFLYNVGTLMLEFQSGNARVKDRFTTADSP